MSKEKQCDSEFCEFCKLYDLRKKALNSDDIKFVKEVLKDFSDLWLNADQERCYYRCVLDGSWPSAKEILTKSLEKIKTE